MSRSIQRTTTEESSAYSQPQRKHTKNRKKSRDDGQIKQLRQILAVFDRENSNVLLSEGLTDLPSILWRKLPQVTSSFDGDLELYTLLAVIVDLCIQSWYHIITTDHTFSNEVLDITVDALGKIVKRLAKVDLKYLLLEELPAIIDDHIQAIEYATRIDASPDGSNIATTFHTLRPHPIFEQRSSQDERALAWSQILVGKVLPLTLTSDEIANPSLRILVSEIFAGMILYNGLYLKLCEPWFLWETITKVIRLQQESKPNHKLGLSDSQTASSIPANTADRSALIHRIIQPVASAWNLSLYGWVVLSTWLATLMRVTFGASSHGKHDGVEVQATPETLNIAKVRTWSLMSHILQFRQRMPWLYGVLAYLQWLLLHGTTKIYRVGNTLSRASSRYIDDQLTDPSLPPTLLRSIRLAIFPDNRFAPNRPQPTSSEIVRIKQECVETVASAVPPIVRKTLFAASDASALQEDIEGSIDAFAYTGINQTLIVSLVELIVVRLFPELE